jgi:hypothetical protein
MCKGIAKPDCSPKPRPSLGLGFRFFVGSGTTAPPDDVWGISHLCPICVGGQVPNSPYQATSSGIRSRATGSVSIPVKLRIAVTERPHQLPIADRMDAGWGAAMAFSRFPASGCGPFITSPRSTAACTVPEMATGGYDAGLLQQRSAGQFDYEQVGLSGRAS